MTPAVEVEGRGPSPPLSISRFSNFAEASEDFLVDCSSETVEESNLSSRPIFSSKDFTSISTNPLSPVSPSPSDGAEFDEYLAVRQQTQPNILKNSASFTSVSPAHSPEYFPPNNLSSTRLTSSIPPHSYVATSKQNTHKVTIKPAFKLQQTEKQRKDTDYVQSHNPAFPYTTNFKGYQTQPQNYGMHAAALQSGVSLQDISPANGVDVNYLRSAGSSEILYLRNDDRDSTKNVNSALNFSTGVKDVTTPAERAEMNKLFLDQSHGFKSNGMLIRVLGVPQQNAKSRVETQTKICIQLVNDKQGGNDDKIQNWSHIRLPENLVMKDKPRARKEGEGLKLHGRSILDMEAIVVCASDPTKIVQACLGCIQRERKRSRKKESAKKLTRDYDDLDEETIAAERRKIILFNCPKVVDFTSGDTILPSRITCYCRHHNEKLGFCIYFILRDHNNQIVATGISPPILITDDHKSTKAAKPRKRIRTEEDEGSDSQPNSPVPDKRMNSASPDNVYNFNSQRPGIKHSLSSSSMNLNMINLPLLSSTTATDFPYFTATDMYLSPEQVSPIATAEPGQSMAGFSLPRTLSSSSFSGLSHMNVLENGDFAQFNVNEQLHSNQNRMAGLIYQQPQQQQQTQQQQGEQSRFHGSNQFLASLAAIPPQVANALISNPIVLKVIPNEGPTHGGLEVTVLGSGFYEGLTVVFGDTPASSTHFWNNSTMVCILPPSPIPGPVPVVIKDHPASGALHDAITTFTYKDDAERALMELALQVVGLRMTGRLEDARNIAMRIFSQSGTNGDSLTASMSPSGMSSALELAGLHVMSARAASVRPSTVVENLQTAILNCLMRNSSSPHLSLPRTSTRHTLLHLAIFSRFTRLSVWLAENADDVESVDINGFAPVHFAAWTGQRDVVRALAYRGVELCLETKLGWTPDELARQGGFPKLADFIEEWQAEDVTSSFDSETEDSTPLRETTSEPSAENRSNPQDNRSRLPSIGSPSRWARNLFGWSEQGKIFAEQNRPSSKLAGPHQPAPVPVDAEPVLSPHSSLWTENTNNVRRPKTPTPNDKVTPPGTAWYSFNPSAIPTITLPLHMLPHINIPNLGITATMQEMQMPQLAFPAVNLPFNNPFQNFQFPQGWPQGFPRGQSNSMSTSKDSDSASVNEKSIQQPMFPVTQETYMPWIAALRQSNSPNGSDLGEQKHLPETSSANTQCACPHHMPRASSSTSPVETSIVCTQPAQTPTKPPREFSLKLFIPLFIILIALALYRVLPGKEARRNVIWSAWGGGGLVVE